MALDKSLFLTAKLCWVSPLRGGISTRTRRRGVLEVCPILQSKVMDCQPGAARGAGPAGAGRSASAGIQQLQLWLVYTLPVIA